MNGIVGVSGPEFGLQNPLEVSVSRMPQRKIIIIFFDRPFFGLRSQGLIKDDAVIGRVLLVAHAAQEQALIGMMMVAHCTLHHSMTHRETL